MDRELKALAGFTSVCICSGMRTKVIDSPQGTRVSRGTLEGPRSQLRAPGPFAGGTAAARRAAGDVTTRGPRPAGARGVLGGVRVS